VLLLSDTAFGRMITSSLFGLPFEPD